MSENTLTTTNEIAQANETAPNTTNSDRAPVMPFVDILEYSDHMTLTFDLPGIARENLSISTEGDLLTVSSTGAKAAPYNCSYREFTPRDFYRQFRISRKFDLGKTEAKYENGELLLTIQKSAEEKPRKILIQ